MSSDQSRDAEFRRTTDPAHVRSVVEERGGYPARDAGMEGQGDGGLLRIGRHGREEELTEIAWEEFEDEFEEEDLVFIYPDDRSDVDGVGTLRKRALE